MESRERSGRKGKSAPEWMDIVPCLTRCPRYTLLADTVRQMRSLAKRECANCFDDGKLCVMLDAPCFQTKSNYLECSYFKECVLPLDKVLQAKVTPGEYKKRDLIKPCTACGKPFLAANNRAKYCDECRADARRKKDAERKRISRQVA